MKYGFLSFLNNSAHSALLGAVRQATSGDVTSINRPPTSRFNLSQLAAKGQPCSPGRTRRTEGRGRVCCAEVLDNGEQPIAKTGKAAALFRKCRLFIIGEVSETSGSGRRSLM